MQQKIAIASIQELKVGQNFLANLRVYTSKNLEGIDKDFTDFFEALDIDQNIEDFIKVYWIYPTKIRFELTDLEEPYPTGLLSESYGSNNISQCTNR